MQSWRHGVRERVAAWEPAVASPAFQRFWPQARHIMPPATPTPNVHVGRLPPQFWSLFWNHPDPSELSLPEDADYIANRLLNGPSALAALWASVHLPADALRACRALRSTKPHTLRSHRQRHRSPSDCAAVTAAGPSAHRSLDDWSEVLDQPTRACWPRVAAASPPSGILMGGTALAVHLRHRRSRDLDVFVHQLFDPEAVLADLRQTSSRRRGSHRRGHTQLQR